MNFIPYCYRLHAANETIITIFMGILWYERRLRMLPDGESSKFTRNFRP